MAEKKCLIAATALMKRAGPILGLSGLDCVNNVNDIKNENMNCLRYSGVSL